VLVRRGAQRLTLMRGPVSPRSLRLRSTHAPYGTPTHSVCTG
jgi:hypothetical protein